MVGRSHLTLVVVACSALVTQVPRARADSAKLDAARAAIDGVRYDDAQGLLAVALQEGGNSTAALVEIYRLSATTAMVLGHPDLADQYYRRWLALDPTAAMPEDVAPKLRGPFVAAQDYMRTRGHLTAAASRPTATAVEVTVSVDPLQMAAAVELSGTSTRTPLGATHVARIEAPQATGAVSLSVVDEYGNHLVELTVTPAPAESHGSPPRGAGTAAHAPAPSALRNWKLWTVPTIAFFGIGLGFGYAASSADTDLTGILDEPTLHTLLDAEGTRDRRDRDALIANLAYGVAGACLVTTIVMYVTRPRAAPARVIPTAAPGSVGLSVVGTF